MRLRRLGIDTRQEVVIYMRADCEVCRSEGLETEARVEVRRGERTITATLNVITSDLLAPGEAGLSEAAWARLGARAGDEVEVAHAAPLDSLGLVRWRDRTPVLVDDIISTAHTMIAAVRQLQRATGGPPVCVGVHAVFTEGAYADLLAAGPARIVTCNTIRHPSNAIDVGPLMAEGVRTVLAAEQRPA